MLENLKQFVPSEVCLSCDGCCRFKEQNSSWRPKVSAEERQNIVVDGVRLIDKVFAQALVDEKNYLKTVSCHDFFRCVFLNSQDNTCGIYHDRPFECRLYPFILSRRNGQAVVFAHGNCPHVQQYRQHASFKDYVEYLRKYFAQKDVILFLQRNPSLIGDYSAYAAELEFLFTISSLDVGGHE